MIGYAIRGKNPPSPVLLNPTFVYAQRIRLSYTMPKDLEDQLTPMKLRQKVGLTQQEVAFRLGVRQGTISDWERRLRTPNLPPSKIKLMLEVYQCSLDELIEAFEGLPHSLEPGGEIDTTN